MQNYWQKRPELGYNKNIIDIVQFGSSVIEGKKPNDIDFAVIFKNISIKEQLNISQEIKLKLQKMAALPIHIISLDLYSLFNEGNFAKEGILIFGKSLISGKYFANKLGLLPKVHISYWLSDKSKKDKVRFNYLLNGKGKKYGLLRKYGGKILKPGLVEIEPCYENIFVEEIKKATPNFKVRRFLEPLE